MIFFSIRAGLLRTATLRSAMEDHHSGLPLHRLRQLAGVYAHGDSEGLFASVEGK